MAGEIFAVHRVSSVLHNRMHDEACAHMHFIKVVYLRGCHWLRKLDSVLARLSSVLRWSQTACNSCSLTLQFTWFSDTQSMALSPCKTASGSCLSLPWPRVAECCLSWAGLHSWRGGQD